MTQFAQLATTRVGHTQQTTFFLPFQICLCCACADFFKSQKSFKLNHGVPKRTLVNIIFVFTLKMTSAKNLCKYDSFSNEYSI